MKAKNWKVVVVLILLVAALVAEDVGKFSIQRENARLKGQIAVLENQNQELRDELLEKSKEICHNKIERFVRC